MITKTKENPLLSVSELKKGNKQAFKAIYEQHIKTLKAFINSSYTKNTAEAEDIAQDVFLKLWSARERLDPQKSIRGFLFKTGHNIFIDKYRKKKVESKLLDDWMHRRLVDMIKNDDSRKTHKLKLVTQAIEILPPRCKEIFELSKFNQLKYHEIASKLDISIKTVESQMGKAYKLIRKEVHKKDNSTFFFVSYKLRLFIFLVCICFV